MIRLNPYLSFNGSCREAMTFYKECFGGELTFMTLGESPVADKFPDDMQDRILHSMLANDGIVLMATDCARSDEKFNPGNDMSLTLNFDNEEELNKIFSKLSEGGDVIDPVKKQFWGGTFGVARDKFGKTWMLEYSEEEPKK